MKFSFLILAIAVALISFASFTTPAQAATSECILNETHCTCQNQALFACPVPRPDKVGYCYAAQCQGIVCACDFNVDPPYPTSICKLDVFPVWEAGEVSGEGDAPCYEFDAKLPLPTWAQPPRQ
mmetsp:Transcript_18354/g.31811  ORF Transcript_18354/g.31811 Transcript_18354/m.31811 type:complete len:124 (+) Transcript_18354:208-579(+)